MRFYRLGMVGLCLLAAAVSFSQSQATPKTTEAAPPPPSRMEQIWGYAMDRVNTQVDVWFEDGEFPKVIQLLRVQFEAEPKDYEIATNLGWMLENIEEYDAALATYVKFRKVTGGYADAALPEAQFYFRRRSYAKVTALLPKYIKNNSHPNNYRMLAHSFERQGMLRDSQRTWRRYIALHPQDLTARRNLERVEKKLKNA
jgi:tetratricopeptide (TPR) repeat protein